MKLAETLIEKNKEDPCWDGYKQVGMKKGKGGKKVPNCIEESAELIEEAAEQTDKTSAAYWSCRQWRAGSKVEG